MKVTVNDLEEIMKEIRAGGEEGLPANVKALTSTLCEMLTQTPYTKELYEAVIKQGLKFAASMDWDAEKTLQTIATLAGSAAIVIGYRLGMREAGLELGIGTPKESK